METKYNYRIGLDIGIASVGWAVLENNSKDEPVHIMDFGVRIFDTAEDPQTGDSLASPRRNARSMRRRLRRRRHRLDRIKQLLEREGLIRIDEFMKRYESAGLPDVYQLRCEALDRKLSDEELAQVLIHIAKHRGFKSNRKAELKEDAEAGKVLNATKENRERMQAGNYRTIGEMIYCDEAFRTSCDWVEKGYILTPRNKADSYKHTVERALLVEEVKKIFEAQRTFNNPKATEELEKAYLSIMESQRSFDMGPGLQADGTESPYALNGFEDRVGYCTLEGKPEKRGAKATYTAELFVVSQKLSHLKLIKRGGEGRFLTKEEKAIVLELLHTQKEVKYSAIRKKLAIPVEYHFNALTYTSKKAHISQEEREKEVEKVVFGKLENYHKMMGCLNEETKQKPVDELQELLDSIATILTLYKSDDKRRECLNALPLSTEEIENLLELTFAKFMNLSVKAMRKLLPYLQGEEGMTYDKACTAAGYDFKAEGEEHKSKLLKGEQVTEIINEIPNPVVKRSVSQTVKVINAIIQKYGSPQAVYIELAREMSKNFKDRKDIEKKNKAREADNEKAKKQIQEYGILSPTGQDIIKFRLWQEQDGICMYSGKRMSIENLFGKNSSCDIDHILPYSQTFDDSYRNKVLVLSSENRQKGNRTPYEYMGQDEERWSEFVARVSSMVNDGKKRDRFFKEHITDEDRKQFKERNLNDTKYITTIVYNLIRQNLEFAPYNVPALKEGKKKHVKAVNGTITAYLRKRWGLPHKDRSTDTHHAMDAVTIACCTEGMIQKISRSMQILELRYMHNGRMFDEETGEIYDRENYTLQEWKDKFGVHIPRPWEEFKNELDVRMGEDPLNFLDIHPDVAKALDYPEYYYPDSANNWKGFIRPIFVSRMPNHKVTGQANKDTVRSPRLFKEGYVISKVPLTSLKLKDDEIVNYYNKESDMLLYNALKRQLQLYSNDAEKAFAQEFHKPKADGSKGPVVKKVKVIEKQSSGVYVHEGKGITANGDMIRIDVFRENGKYFFVPIYAADVVKKVLPNKAATQNKTYENWREMKDENFVFSLYPKDLIHIKTKKEDGLKLNLVSGGQVKTQEVIAYYTGADVATASIAGKASDSGFSFRSLGIQSLTIFEKCQVDVLGNISIVKHEKRMDFSAKKH